jgi:predicted permease
MRFFRRRQFESDMDHELRFHMAAYIADLVRSGVEPQEAARLARVEFGAVEAVKDECRRAWGLQRIDELLADLRFTLRGLRKAPGFATIAILSLALGIGANTAIFGLVDAVMLRFLPVRDPGQLVFVQNVGTRGPNGGPPYPCFELLRDKVESFAGMAAFSASNMELMIDGGREQARGLWVSGNLYQLLGVRPLIGRALSASDDQTPGKGGTDGPVAVISHAYWQQRFGGDPGVVGRKIHMFEHTVTIVGVMRPEFMSLEPGRPIDIAAPMMLSDPMTLRDRGSWWLYIVARLKPGVAAEQARVESDTLFQAYMSSISMSPAIRKMAFDHIELTPAAKGMDGLRTQFSKPLTAMTILVGLVLLAACANAANLMVARATARQKEFAVRAALGAGRGRLIRQSLTDSLVLAGTGAVLGIGIARLGETALASFFAEGNNKIIVDLSLDWRMLLFTLAVSVLTGLASGILPALRAAQVDPAAGLQIGSRTFAGSRRSVRLSRALVVLQVALSTVLLAGAGIFIHSLRQLESVDLGFARNGVLTMEITPEYQLYGTPRWLAIDREILDRVARIPGVQSVSWSTMSPLSGRNRGVGIDVPTFVPNGPTDREIHLVSVSPEYFATFDVPVLRGRTFTLRDDGIAPKVAVLNQTAAHYYFGAVNPIGKKVTLPRHALLGSARPVPTDPVYEIIGVVKDTKHGSLREEPLRFLYLPIPQSIDRINRMALAVRCSGDPMAFAGPVRKQVQIVRPTLLITNISTIEKQVQLSLIRERLVSTLSTAFGLLALVLACIGLYGILAYGVALRTNEIGIRMALGSTSRRIVWTVLREALELAGIGIAAGLPAALALGRITKALLYGMGPFDLPALACAVLLLLIFSAVAAVVPARRASRLDPMSALRCE